VLAPLTSIVSTTHQLILSHLSAFCPPHLIAGGFIEADRRWLPGCYSTVQLILAFVKKDFERY